MTLVAGMLGAAVGIGIQAPSDAKAAVAPVGQGFNLNAGDMRFILKQIKIAENHATKETGPGQPLVGSGPNQIPSPLLPFGLRTVDGSENNLQPNQSKFGAAHEKFPRLTKPVFNDAEMPGPFAAPGSPQTSYKQKRGAVVDSHPRVASNLIVDQTSSNPAAVKAAGKPHRTFLGEPSVPCPAPPDPQPEGCTPEGKTLFMPNVTTDVGLSPPYNSWFTIFGQFFDHGIDSTTKGGSGTVFVPLKGDDPLIAGPDRVLGDNPDTPANEKADDLPPSQQFMVLTRAKNQPGPDGVLGNNPATPGDESADDIQDATNTDSSWVDQSQTYTSHSSHQVFLREYDMNAAGRPVSSGRMLKGPDGGMAPWSKVKAEAAAKLGIKLVDADVLNIPLLATDQYGRFLRGPARDMPQIVTADGLVEGDLATPVAVPSNAKRINTAFLDDIAHNAVPKQATPQQGPTPAKPALTPDTDTSITGATGTQDAGTYDDEMLDAHFIAGDGRVNENIALTAVHQIFHSEHNRLVDYMEKLIVDKNIDVAEWKLADGSWNGERIFQAARFVTEMEYQHMVFEEFGRKVQPGIDPFAPGAPAQTDLDPAVKAEFAHAVYRFGHSMLNDTVARTNPDGTKNDIELLDAFLNPPAYTKNGDKPKMTPEEAAGSIVQGMTDQAGNELDEFVGETLRSNLLGLPLDLATLNMTRARETGVPSLNVLRKQLHASTNEASLKPYTDWVDFGLSIKHPDSLVNFMAAYGQHPSIKAATTLKDKRIAAQLIHDNSTANENTPADSADFMNSTGEWANKPTGLDDVDLWVGGLAESTNLFSGLLGSTFNYVFEAQLTDLQNGDRFYYLSRTAGLNLRTQLEGNSFAELSMRNTDAQALKADVFSTADCEFELKNLQGTTAGAIADDPASECDESALLVRMADGTIRYRVQNTVDPAGLNAQSTFNGTAAGDKIHGGVDTDTFWGNGGNDRIEGNDGGDVALGGEGDDIITDSHGDDNMKGGDGHDAISAGPGLDLIQSGFGQDFVDGGLNANTVFAGEDDDRIIGGNGADTVEGGGGDDWVEGGNGNDLLQGDSGAPFFDDNNEPGGDVISGDGGDDDYDAEGGDDIMLAGPGIERNAGVSGFDWVTHVRDPQAANSDLDRRFVFEPAPEVTTRDRFQQVEGLSGGPMDDTLRGDSEIPLAGDDLTTAGTAKIAGLQDLLGGATTFTGGNIILGGAGGDVIEGRGGNDLIDGDRYLNVKLEAPDLSTVDNTTDTKLVDSMSALQADVFAGKINPAEIKIVRKIEPMAAGTSIDTAVFADVRANYTITPSVDPTEVVVAHTGGLLTDGNDTIKNVERLRFADETVDLTPANSAATGTVDISDITPAEDQLLTATRAFSDAQGVDAATIEFAWQTEARNDEWVTVGTGETFTPDAPLAGARLRVMATFLDNAGVRETVFSQATAAVTPGPGTVVPLDVPGGGGGAAAAAPVDGAAPRQGRGRGRGGRAVVPAIVAGAATPATVALTVPAGATVVQINVSQLTGTAQAARKTARGKRLIASVYRKAPKAKRYTFRLTERKLRRLKPGRYLIEIRVGKSRAELGPVTKRILTVKAAKKVKRAG